MRQTETLSPPPVLPWQVNLCSLLRVPARSQPFPSLSLQSIYGCPDPYPAVISQCFCPFLPGKRRSHDTGQSFDSREYPCNAISTGEGYRGCSHSFMFRPPYQLDLLIAPATEFLLKAARPYTPRSTQSVTCPGLWHRYDRNRTIVITGLSPARL